MNLSSFFVETLLSGLNIDPVDIGMLRIASAVGTVDGVGFPKELIGLNAHTIARGLLNYSILQMRRDWVYPFWVSRQLEKESPTFIPRAHNPLLINITNRNWTMVGSPGGRYEAVVDPRGLITPLPREWSVDVWLQDEDGMFFPSLAGSAEQTYDANAPCITTVFLNNGLTLSSESFCSTIKNGSDILFNRIVVRSNAPEQRSGTLFVALRPFNPEGVAPVQSIRFRTRRIMEVNDTVGIVFREDPTWRAFGNAKSGDVANVLRDRHDALPLSDLYGATNGDSVACPLGLAHAIAAFPFNVDANTPFQSHFSIALNDEQQLKKLPVKNTWRVSYEKRAERHRVAWRRELANSADFRFANTPMQQLFDASRAALLQLHDGGFFSPGPWTYHHFWFRDAVIMLRALDVLNYSKRSQHTIEAFRKYQTSAGFYKAPNGEWDSNGMVLWYMNERLKLQDANTFVKPLLPDLRRAGEWIKRMRRTQANPAAPEEHAGIMPASLSAEHLGTVDQYYWDSFWSLAGLRGLEQIAASLGDKTTEESSRIEAALFEKDLLASLAKSAAGLGHNHIPAGPNKSFDESAVGSLCAMYPLMLFPENLSVKESLEKFTELYVDTTGFFHPIIHSGYNVYLTLQIAHSFLLLGDHDKAWEIAEGILSIIKPPYSIPEAIHPFGGGAMGDGHHGWAAAEIVLFLRDCVVAEREDRLELFQAAIPRLIKRGVTFEMENIPTRFGRIGCSLHYETEHVVEMVFTILPHPVSALRSVRIHLPFQVLRIRSTASVDTEQGSGGSVVLLPPVSTTAILYI